MTGTHHQRDRGFHAPPPKGDVMASIDVEIEYIGCACYKQQLQWYIQLKPKWFHSGKSDGNSNINWHCRKCNEIVEIWSFNRATLLEARMRYEKEGKYNG